MNQSRRALGAYGENRIARRYQQQGYTLVARNWRCKEGEIDLVASRGNTLVFCEVKTRSTNAFGTPAEAVTIAKQRRLRRLAVTFLAEKKVSAAEIRFDVGTLSGNEVHIIEAAF